jgi:hypothetical protein
MSQVYKNINVSFEPAEVFLASNGFPVGNFEIIPLCITANTWGVIDCLSGEKKSGCQELDTLLKDLFKKAFIDYSCQFIVSLKISQNPIAGYTGLKEYLITASGLREKKES